MLLYYVLTATATSLMAVSSFPYEQGSRQLDDYQVPVVTPTVITKSKSDATNLPRYGSEPTGTNPLGSCYLGTAYGCTSGGTGRLNPTLNSSPPIYTNTTSIYTASGALQTTNPLSLSAPSSALATSSKSEVPHRPSYRKSPTHRLPPHGPLHAPGAPPAFSSSSISALEAGAVASPTMSSTGTVSYQNLVGHPIESGVASPINTELAPGPPPGFLPGYPPGPPGWFPFCPPRFTITLTSTATVTITELVSIAPLNTQVTTQMSTAPSGLENGTTLHRPTNGTDTSTGVYLVTIPTTVSTKTPVKISRKAAGEVSDRTSISTSAKTFEKAHDETSDKTSTLRSTETFGRAAGK